MDVSLPAVSSALGPLWSSPQHPHQIFHPSRSHALIWAEKCELGVRLRGNWFCSVSSSVGELVLWVGKARTVGAFPFTGICSLK